MKFIRYFIAVCMFILLVNAKTTSQDPYETFYEYDEIAILLKIDKLGNYEMDAAYYNDSLYLPLITLFKVLGIYVWHSPKIDTISGYILKEANSFTFNIQEGTIQFGEKTKKLTSHQMITTPMDVFVPIDILEEVFDFTLEFNFRFLTVNFSSDIEMPIIKQLRIEKLRENMRVLTGEVHSDTTYKRPFQIIGGGVIDWSMQLNQSTEQGGNNQQLKASVGLQLFGGELNLRSHVFRDSTLHFGSQSAKWKYINDNHTFIRQIETGFIGIPTILPIASQIIGLKLTNIPNAYKKTYGTYFLERKTNPGWEIELYINNNLIGFTTSDVNGLFSFEIPLVFGNSEILLKYYGPWGEEQEEQLTINIPYSFTRHKKVEYQTFSGFTSDSLNSFISHNKIAYGLNKRVTISGGYELSRKGVDQKHIIFASANMMLGRKTLINYTYVHQTVHDISMLTRTKNNLFIELKHKQFVPNQSIFSSTNLAESQIAFNFPFSVKKLKVNFKNTSRMNFHVTQNSFFNESALSVLKNRTNWGLTYTASLTEKSKSYLGLNGSIHLKKNYSLYMFSLYDISENKMNSVRIQAQKKFKRNMYMVGSYYYDFLKSNHSVNISLYVDLKPMRISAGASADKSGLSSFQNLAGSMILSKKPAPVQFTNTTNTGKGGIDILPYLDINHNNVKEPDEPMVKNVSVGINKGKEVLADVDTIHRFISLEPYAQHLIKISNSGFPYISWILEQKTLAVFPSPNVIQQIYVPIKPMGEIEMEVKIKTTQNNILPASKLLLYIYSESDELVHKGLTEKDGYFNFMGLSPGKYKIKLDDRQLQALSLNKPETDFGFEVKAIPEGDFIDGLVLYLQKKTD
ncbi:MAG TPA: hypothetical protein PLU49_08060 [Saprospiraceae bacterium]|nr:hypothetical protein [Saprospiraceae bacterium]